MLTCFLRHNFYMNSINQNLLYQSDFLLDARSQSREPRAHKHIWWIFIGIASLLVIRLILEYVQVATGNTVSDALFVISDHVTYPVTATLLSQGGSTDYSAIAIVSIAIGGYFLLTAIIAIILTPRTSHRSKIERARMLSQRRYSHQ